MEKMRNDLIEVEEFTHPMMEDVKLNLSTYQKFPIENIAALGVGFQPLITGLQHVITGEGGSGLYYVNTKGSTMMTLKSSGNFFSSLKSATGGVGGGQAELTAYFDPTMLCMGVALVAIQKKMDQITELQQEMMDFLEMKERAKLRGDIKTLMDTMNNYKFNWDNEKYKTNKHILVQDIRKESEQSIDLYRNQIVKLAEKKQLIQEDHSIQTKLKKLQGLFKDYQMALYQFAFSSLLEVMLLENYDKQYLSSVSGRIQELTLSYRELYTDCYNQIESHSKKSVQSMLVGGFSGASKGAGELLSKVPLLSKGPVDEALVAAGKRISELNDNKTENTMGLLIEAAHTCTAPFIDAIDKLQALYNEPVEILFDRKNIYLKSA